ncbi:uncharacterized protein [Ptychodera flava]|uniref:uncharacterized protein n=1 Tax=Ptychodera flava TaxID=63121 RepID=UPI00396A2E14
MKVVLLFALALAIFYCPSLVVHSEDLCENSCIDANDSSCDDAGEGADYVLSYCAYGSDCADCGVRSLNLSAEALCLDTCYERNRDGVCDDSGPGSDTVSCYYGTDCTDCGPRFLTGPDELCSDDCENANDTYCDDGGYGSYELGCEYGTDCIDCGPRFYEEYVGPTVVLPVPTTPPIDIQCSDMCRYSKDQFCDDGVDALRDVYSYCQVGTDCTDCGARVIDLTVPLCTDSCAEYNNSICNDSGPGSRNRDCIFGSDCSDCGPRFLTGPIELCDDSCDTAQDGECDDSGLASHTWGCQYGTDCTDCGIRYYDDYPTTESPTAARVTDAPQSKSDKLLTAIVVMMVFCLIFMVVGLVFSQLLNHKLIKALKAHNKQNQDRSAEDGDGSDKPKNNGVQPHHPRNPKRGQAFTVAEMTPVDSF